MDVDGVQFTAPLCDLHLQSVCVCACVCERYRCIYIERESEKGSQLYVQFLGLFHTFRAQYFHENVSSYLRCTLNNNTKVIYLFTVIASPLYMNVEHLVCCDWS